MEIHGQRGNPKFLLLGMPFWAILSPPLSLAYVCSIIKDAGWECKPVDMNIYLYHLATEEDRLQWNNPMVFTYDAKILSPLFERFRDPIEKKFLELFQENSYDLIGLSVTDQSRYFSLQTAKLLSSLKPGVPIIFGGPECFPGEYGTKFLIESDLSPDLVFQGEAEIGLTQFLKEFERTRDYKTSVPGFAFKEDGKIIETGEPELPKLRDNASIADYSQFNYGDYQRRIIYSFFSKGCVNKCAFCNEWFNYRRFRNRKPEVVLQEIQNALPYAGRSGESPYEVSFCDSIFNGNLRLVDQLCDLIIGSGITIQWAAELSFSRPLERPLLEKMHQAGCRHVFWGLESASPKVLKLMGKNYTMDTVKKVLSDTIDLGITNHLAIIVGFPGETAEDIVTTATFISEYQKNSFINFPYVQPIQIKKNTLLYSNYMHYGIKDIDLFDWVTEDKKNDRQVRLFRWFLLRNILHNPELSFEKCVHWEDYVIGLFDFNALALASEIASTILALGSTSHQEEKSIAFLENWEGSAEFSLSQEELSYWHPEKMDRALRLNKWFSSDKNSRESKERIVTFLLESLKNIGRRSNKGFDQRELRA